MTNYEKESQSILKTLNQLFEGIEVLDGELILKSFHPRARVYSAEEDSVEGVPINIYCKRMMNEINQDPNNPFRREKPQRDVIYINIAGDVASVKTEWKFTTGKVTEYFTFVKIGGSWHIVNKVWSTQRNSQ